MNSSSASSRNLNFKLKQLFLLCKVSNLVSRELEAESIVVFDEAHNIDNVCIEALSVTLDRKALEESAKSVNLLQKRVADMKASDSSRLAKEVPFVIPMCAAAQMTVPLLLSPYFPYFPSISCAGYYHSRLFYLSPLSIHLTLINQYADLVNGLADQGIFQRGRGQGQGQAAASSSASSSGGIQSAAGQCTLTALHCGDLSLLCRCGGVTVLLFA